MLYICCKFLQIQTKVTQMKVNKYNIGQKVAIKAATDLIPRLVIIQELSIALNVKVRTVYNYINMSCESDGLPIEKLEAIARVLECEVSELYAQSEIPA